MSPSPSSKPWLGGKGENYVRAATTTVATATPAITIVARRQRHYQNGIVLSADQWFPLKISSKYVGSSLSWIGGDSTLTDITCLDFIFIELYENNNNDQIYQIVPASMGLCLELAYPITNSSSSSSRDSAPFRHRLPLNLFIDSILRTVYHASAPPPEGHGVRRQIIFTSSSPDACAAVNWKQPNCQSPAPYTSRFVSFLSPFGTSIKSLTCGGFFFFPL